MPFTPEFLEALASVRAWFRSRPGLTAFLAVTAVSALMVCHLLILTGLVGTTAVPYVVRSYLAREISRDLGRSISLESVGFNPFTFVLEAKGLKVADKQGDGILAGFDRLYLNLDPANLINRRVTLRGFSLVNPSVHLSRTAEGNLNIADLIPKSSPDEADSAHSFEFVMPNLRYSLSDVRITGGSVSFDDEITGTHQELKDLHFTIDSLESDQPGLHEIFNSGGVLNESNVTLTVKADLNGEHPEAEARLSVRDVVFRHYMPFLLPLKRIVDLKMDQGGVFARVTFSREGGKVSPPRFEGNAKFSGVSLAAGTERVAGFDTLEIQGASFDLGDGNGPRLERVELSSPYLKASRDEAGIVDLLNLLEISGQPEQAGKGGSVSTASALARGGAASASPKPDAAKSGQAEGKAQGVPSKNTAALDAATQSAASQGAPGPSAQDKPSAPSGGKEDTSGKPPVSADAARSPGLVLGEAAIKDAQVDLIDQEMGITVSLKNLNASLKGLDTAAGRFDSLSLEAAGDRFRSFDLDIKGGYAPLDLTGSANFEGVDLSKPLPALKRLLPRLGLSGTGACKVNLSLNEKSGKVTPTLSADLSIQNARVMAEGQNLPLFSAASLALTGIKPDLAAGRVLADQLSINGGGAALKRDAEGRFPALYSLGGQEKNQQGTGDKPLVLALGKASLAGFALEYVDERDKAQYKIDLQSLEVQNVSSDFAKPLTMAVKGVLGGQTPFDVSGEVRPKDVSADLKLTASNIPLAEASRLAGPQPVDVLDGQASLSGSLSVSLDKNGPKASFQGDAGVSGLKLASPGEKNPWAILAGITLKGGAFTLSPLSFKAAQVSLDQPWLGVVLDKQGLPENPLSPAKPAAATGSDGQQASGSGSGEAQVAPKQTAGAGKTLKGQKAAPGEAGPAPGQTGTQAARPVLEYSIDNLDIREGRIDITGPDLDPPLWTAVTDIQANIADVRTGQSARVNLSFGAGHTGQFKAQGLAGWVSDAPSLDLKADLTNLDLGEFSPLSRKFTGFPITRGKLGLKMDYKAARKVLDLKNSIEVDGIQLGRKTARSGEKDVPLDLAVSLLSDNKGRINLDIPITGDLEQAKADMSDVVSTAVGGVFTKILLSPLAFLNVAQSGGQTAYLDFAPGSAQLTPEAQKTLASLSTAMAQRPRLSIEVMAYADPSAEGPALAAALANASTSGERVASPAPAQLSPSDWARLARQRQDAVLSYLTGTGKLAQGRIYPISGDALRPPVVKGQAGSRAEIKLRY